MCNLYSLTKGQDALRDMFGIKPGNDRTGNLPPMPGVYPDYAAPIVRAGADGRELVMARWGMPTPPEYLVTKTGKPKASDGGVTNIRHFNSPHWRRWLGVESRCVVPFTAFSENEALPDGSKPPIWFALDSNSFALIAYAPCWAKRWHHDAFLTAILNSQPMGFYSASSLVTDARKHGVVVWPPRQHTFPQSV